MIIILENFKVSGNRTTFHSFLHSESSYVQSSGNKSQEHHDQTMHSSLRSALAVPWREASCYRAHQRPERRKLEWQCLGWWGTKQENIFSRFKGESLRLTGMRAPVGSDQPTDTPHLLFLLLHVPHKGFLQNRFAPQVTLSKTIKPSKITLKLTKEYESLLPNNIDANSKR